MSQVIIRIPTPLRSFTDGAAEVSVEGESVADALDALGRVHDGLLERVLDGEKLRPFVNVFLGPDDVRTLDGLTTPVSDGAVLSIIPAVAGGGS